MEWSVFIPMTIAGRRSLSNRMLRCHPKGEAGLGPAVNDKPLPAWLIRFQVRNGLGAMPSFAVRQISPAELDDLVAYLEALRTHGRS